MYRTPHSNAIQLELPDDLSLWCEAIEIFDRAAAQFQLSEPSKFAMLFEAISDSVNYLKIEPFIQSTCASYDELKHAILKASEVHSKRRSIQTLPLPHESSQRIRSYQPQRQQHHQQPPQSDPHIDVIRQLSAQVSNMANLLEQIGKKIVSLPDQKHSNPPQSNQQPSDHPNSPSLIQPQTETHPHELTDLIHKPTQTDQPTTHEFLNDIRFLFIDEPIATDQPEQTPHDSEVHSTSQAQPDDPKQTNLIELQSVEQEFRTIVNKPVETPVHPIKLNATEPNIIQFDSNRSPPDSIPLSSDLPSKPPDLIQTANATDCKPTDEPSEATRTSSSQQHQPDTYQMNLSKYISARKAASETIPGSSDEIAKNLWMNASEFSLTELLNQLNPYLKQLPRKHAHLFRVA